MKAAQSIILSVTLLIFACIQLKAQDVSRIVEAVSNSVVMIVVYNASGSIISQGSGVFITNEGRILTNAHVVEDAYSAEISSSVGTFDHVKVLYLDEKRDLALLQVQTALSRPPRFDLKAGYKAGQRVIAIGNPLGLERTVSDGLISGIRRTGDGLELIQTTVPISPGSSGGVLLNEEGAVIGITSSTFEGAQNINFAIGITSILAFVEDYRQSDPSRSKITALAKAGEYVWWRVALSWIGSILLLLVSLLFGDTFYFAIPLIFVAGYTLYVIFKGIHWIVTLPARALKRSDSDTMVAASTSSTSPIHNGDHFMSEDDCIELLEKIEDLLSSIGSIPTVFQTGPAQTPLGMNAFDPNRWLSEVFHEIHLAKGYKLDYVYLRDLHGGEPFLYARKATQRPFANSKEYFAATGITQPTMLLGGEPTPETCRPWCEALMFSQSPVGFFQFGLFCMIARRFYLIDHSNYNSRKYILVEPTREEFRLRNVGNLTWAEGDTLGNLDPRPRIRLSGSTAKVFLLTYEVNKGYSRLEINLRSPNVFLGIRDETLIAPHSRLLF